MAYEKKEDGVFWHPGYGRVMEHRGYGTRIHWSESMLDYLRTHYARTINQELCDHLCVSQRTMIRKARELGLQKDRRWLTEVWNERRKLAHMIARAKGYPWKFMPGDDRGKACQYKKGHRLTAEQEAKRVVAVHEWAKRHRKETRERMLKAWETRRQRYGESGHAAGYRKKEGGRGEGTALESAGTAAQGMSAGTAGKSQGTAAQGSHGTAVVVNSERLQRVIDNADFDMKVSVTWRLKNLTTINNAEDKR
jgi:hypothetical protein